MASELLVLILVIEPNEKILSCLEFLIAARMISLIDV